MKKNLSLCFATLFAFVSIAQNLPFKITSSEESQFKDGLPVYLGTDNQHHYFYTIETKARPGFGGVRYLYEYTLQRSDKLYSEVLAEGELADDRSYKDYEITELIMEGGNAFALLEKEDKKSDQKKYYLNNIDLNTLKLSGEKTYLGAVIDDADEYVFLTSEDDSKIAIISANIDGKKAQQEFEILVADVEEGLLWKDDFKPPYTDKLFSSKEMKVDNRGFVYIAGKLFNEKRQSTVKVKKAGEKVKVANYSYDLFIYKGNPELAEYKIALGDQFISDLDLRVTDENKLQILGFYSDKSQERMQGIFNILYDPESASVIKSNKAEFPEDFVKSAQARFIFKKEEDLGNFDITHIFFKDNDHMVMFAEQIDITESSYRQRNSNGGYTYVTQFAHHLRHIIAIELDEHGDIVWTQVLPKMQTAKYGGVVDPEYIRHSLPRISYEVVKNGNKFHVFYNVIEKNLDETKIDELDACIRCKRVPVVKTLDDDGKVDIIKYPIPDDKWLLQIGRTYQLDDNELFTILSGKKRSMTQIWNFE